METQENGSALPEANEIIAASVTPQQEQERIIADNMAAIKALPESLLVTVKPALQSAIDTAQRKLDAIIHGEEVATGTAIIKPQVGLLDLTGVPDGCWVINVQVAGGKQVPEALRITNNRVLTTVAESKAGVVGAGEVKVNGQSYGSITAALKTLFPELYKEGKSVNYRPALIEACTVKGWNCVLPAPVQRA